MVSLNSIWVNYGYEKSFGYPEFFWKSINLNSLQSGLWPHINNSFFSVTAAEWCYPADICLITQCDRVSTWIGISLS